MNKKGSQVTFNSLLAKEFLDMVDNAFFFFDRKLRFVYVNKKGEKMAGKNKKQLVGKKIIDVFPEVLNKSVYKVFLQFGKLNGKTPFEYYSPSLKKWFSIRVYPNRLGFGVCAKDITEVKKAQQIAKVSQNTLAAFFDNSPVGLAIYDEDMKILRVDNSSAKKFFGKKAKDLVGKSLQEISPKNADVIDTVFKKILKDNKPFRSELSILDKSGNVVYGSSSRFPIQLANGKKGVGAITLDITERVQHEKRKDDFIAMASHELKTPLTTAKIFTQVLTKRFEKLKDTESGKLLKKVNAKMDQLENLIKELLDVSVINQGKLHIKKEKFILKEIALATIADIQMTTNHKLIVDWQTHDYLFADKDKVSQIFINFITNAIKYSPDKSDIIIRSQRDKKFIVVSIQDFGIGISKDDQMFIFDKFYQVKNHNTYPGLGLGLHIAKEIITRIGGQIWFESEEGKGSTFYFSLPIYKKK